RTVSYRIRTNGTAFNETPAQIGPWFNRPTWEATLLFPSRWVQESTITGPAVVEPIYGSIRAGSSRPIGIHRCRLQACETRLHAALAVSYFQSVDYRSMRARTQRVYRGMIERFCEQADKDGN